jgi:hypothetical protein
MHHPPHDPSRETRLNYSAPTGVWAIENDLADDCLGLAPATEETETFMNWFDEVTATIPRSHGSNVGDFHIIFSKL